MPITNPTRIAKDQAWSAVSNRQIAEAFACDEDCPMKVEAYLKHDSTPLFSVDVVAGTDRKPVWDNSVLPEEFHGGPIRATVTCGDRLYENHLDLNFLWTSSYSGERTNVETVVGQEVGAQAATA
jgi:hypothetical protein